MSVSISYYGNKKPAAGVKPIQQVTVPDRTPKTRLPFGQRNPIDWMTGKHLVQFNQEATADKTPSGMGDLVGEDKNTLFYDGGIWVANDVLKWDKLAGTNGRLMLDFSSAEVRAWNAAMPGILFKQPNGASLMPGLFLNLENNDAYGNRLDLGWGGSGGGNFELYSKEHDARPGQFRVIYGGGDFGHSQYTHYDGTDWRVTCGLTKDGRFFCGLKETGFPGTTDATTLRNTGDAPAHPLQVYNESRFTPASVFHVERTGAIWAKAALSTAPTSLPAKSYQLWQNTTEHHTDEVKITVSDADGTHKTHDLTRTPILDGTAEGQVLRWNATSEAWETAALTQITVITAWRLDKTNHRFQVKTRTAYVYAPGDESSWTNVIDANGGVLDEGVIEE